MMQPPSVSLLIAAATTYIASEDCDEERRRFEARSAFVERLLLEMHCELTGDAATAAWHTAFISHVGYWSHYDHEHGASSWPLPATASADELGKFAAERGVLSVRPPEPGELFLVWSPAREVFVRTGIVLRPGDVALDIRGNPYQRAVTIEANTSEARDQRGGLVLKHTRRLSVERGDRYVRWMDLDVRADRMAGFLVRGAQGAERSASDGGGE